MREIEFRGKRVDSGEWVYGSLVHSELIRNHKTGILLKTINMSAEGIFECDVFKIDPATVGQYTGLKDSKGRKIFEGDIVQVRFNDFDEWEIYTVEYCSDEDYPAFDLKPNMDCECNGLSYAVICCEIEVIGSIHDTRKL